MDKVIKDGTDMTIGVDLGDKWSRLCVLDEHGEVCEEGRIASSVSSSRIRFFAAASSACSSKVMPASRPASMRACRRQTYIVCSLMPRSRETSATFFPPSTRSITRRRNSAG